MQASDMNICRLPQTNKVLSALTLFALTAFLWLAASASTQAQDAKAIMQKVIANYQGMSSYEGRASADRQIITTNNKVLLSADVGITMAYKRPNKIKLEFSMPTGGQSIYSDGVTVTSYSSKLKTYYRIPSGSTPQQLVLQLQKMQVSISLDTLHFLCVGALPNNVTNLRLKGTESSNGRPVYVVTGLLRSASRQITSPQGKKYTVPAVTSYWTWWIDKQTSLLLHMEQRLENLPLAVMVIENKKPVKKTINTTDRLRQIIFNPKPNPALDDSMFVFTPPPGATEIKSAQQLLNGK